MESVPTYREELLERGRMLWNCHFRKYVSYDAPKQTFELQLVCPSPPSLLAPLIGHETQSWNIVDMAMYYELHRMSDLEQASNPHPRGRDDLGKPATDRDEPPSDEFLLTLPAKVSAYWFLKKRWGEFCNM